MIGASGSPLFPLVSVSLPRSTSLQEEDQMSATAVTLIKKVRSLKIYRQPGETDLLSLL